MSGSEPPLTDQQFETREALEQWLANRLVDQGVTNELAHGFADALSQRFAPSGRPSGSFGAIAGGWAVRNEDLDVIDAIARGLVAAIGVYAGGPLAVGATAAALALVVFLYSAVQSGVKITDEQRSVLLALKMPEGPCHSVALLQRLSIGLPQGEWTKEKLRSTLTSLEKVAMRRGTIIPLVKQAADGRWHVQDL